MIIVWNFKFRIILLIPGLHLVSYVHSWQIVLKSLGLPQFEFNTYIITVLVIFFHQMHYDLPTVDEISNPAPKKRSKTVDSAAIARQFFTFYSKNYEIGNHIISPQIGQWQEKRLQRQQKNFSNAKKRCGLLTFFIAVRIFLHFISIFV